jgi:DNA polymerase elongation subunit (family B)
VEGERLDMQRGLVTGIEYSVKKDEQGNKFPVIFLFIRGEDGERYTFTDTSFEPYFYIGFEPYIWDRLEMLQKLKWYNTDYYSFPLRLPLRRIYLDVPSSVGAVRRSLENKWKIQTFEADVLFVLRYMIDRNIHAYVDFDMDEYVVNPVDDDSIYIEPRVATIDIEAMADETSETVNVAGPEPICCVTIHDSYEDKYYVFYLDGDIHIHHIGDNVKLVPSATEQGVLTNVLAFLYTRDYDVYSGFYLSKYDIPKLIERMRVYRLPYHRLSPTEYIRRNREGSITIKGRSIFDVFMAYKRYILKELDEYSLDFISREELNEGKMELPYSTFREAWEKDPNLVIEYNIKDVELTKRVSDKLDLLGQFMERAKIAGVRLEDVFSPARVIDVVYLRQARKLGIVLPTKVRHEKVDIPGAWVEEPDQGTLYHNVACYDFSEMYPSLIDALNISFETWRGKIGDLRLSDTTSFTSEFKGLLPSVVDTYREARGLVKQQLKDATGDDYKYLQRKSASLKSIINATYGLTGLPVFRLYDPHFVAASITEAARMLILYVKERIEKELGLQVVYGDTDSVFIQLSNGGDMIASAENLLPILNQYTKDFSESLGIDEEDVITMGLDKVYSHFLVLTKKRYYGKGIYRNGNLENFDETKGIELKRTDSCYLARDVQRTLLNMTLDGRTVDEKLEYLTNLKEELKHPSYTTRFMYLGIPTQIKKSLITKEQYLAKLSPSQRKKRLQDKKFPETIYATNPAHVKAARYSNQHLGTRFGAGSKPRWVYVDKVPEDHMIVKPKPKRKKKKKADDSKPKKKKRKSTPKKPKPIKMIPDTNVIAFDKYTVIPEGYGIDVNKVIKRRIQKKVNEVLEWDNISFLLYEKPVKKPKKKKTSKKKVKKKVEVV